ncbi:16S rRNA (cytosine(967)-C(5))-methyltransferase RsmB, partial [Escherichia coli]|nr:16S rRNA (cytosine(967)-C(5))-methyltransferase RsmB [Escherichia coli]
MKKQRNLRSMAAQAVEQVVEQGQSLSNILPPLQQKVSDKDKALLQELCFGVLRTLSQLDWLINKLMARPMTGKQRTVHYLIMVGLYQLLYTRIPPHAALAETVEGAVAIKRPQLKGLINGVLRQFQRQQEELLAEFNASDACYLHPSWLLKRLQKAYPEQWQSIVEANNQRPPMWLRVNRTHHSRDSWLALLDEAGMKGFPHADYPDAVRLETPAPVHVLPGFEEGWVTVQDASAQGCMAWLAPQNGEHILDLCAAPGGKTTHILEVAPEAQVVAVDIDEQRLSRVYDNLKRLGMKATVKQGDGRYPSQWCGEQQFDRILLDAPCSATGVIRRHPDIKWLRRDRDIP